MRGDGGTGILGNIARDFVANETENEYELEMTRKLVVKWQGNECENDKETRVKNTRKQV